jgi:hypothetical protein
LTVRIDYLKYFDANKGAINHLKRALLFGRKDNRFPSISDKKAAKTSGFLPSFDSFRTPPSQKKIRFC